MKTIWVKNWVRKKVSVSLGACLNEWSFPLSVCLWDGQSMCITVLCFYLGVDWDLGPDLADRMVKSLEEL